MNTTGWGGHRTGSGQKGPATVIDGGAASDVNPLPPEDLPLEQKVFWQEYAPLAIEKRTLTRHTMPAFRLLCELSDERLQTKKVLDEQGRTYEKAWADSSGQEHIELKAHPLVGAYGRLTKHVESLMARFGLAPFGKPEGPIQKRKAENPWAKLA